MLTEATQQPVPEPRGMAGGAPPRRLSRQRGAQPETGTQDTDS